MMLCSKLHCQKFFRLKRFSYKIDRDGGALAARHNPEGLRAAAERGGNNVNCSADVRGEEYFEDFLGENGPSLGQNLALADLKCGEWTRQGFHKNTLLPPMPFLDSHVVKHRFFVTLEPSGQTLLVKPRDKLAKVKIWPHPAPALHFPAPLRVSSS